MLTYLRNKLLGTQTLQADLAKLKKDLDCLKILQANSIISRIKSSEVFSDLASVEFRVFSQFGEDGIIQYLIHHTGIQRHEENFIEIGVENYVECNTRFLLENNNWAGLVIDSSSLNIDFIKKQEISWRHHLEAISEHASVTNINEIINKYGWQKDIGLLSIDIDGNDYWLWESITSINPIIVVIEYNSHFGKEKAVSIPYEENFSRQKAHHSMLYWGASIKAFSYLAAQKGYYLVGSNSNANNLFFVRKDRIGKIPILTSEEAYRESKFRDSRDQHGNLSYLSGNDRIKVIAEMPLLEIPTKRSLRVKDL